MNLREEMSEGKATEVQDRERQIRQVKEREDKLTHVIVLRLYFMFILREELSLGRTSTG